MNSRFSMEAPLIAASTYRPSDAALAFPDESSEVLKSPAKTINNMLADLSQHWQTFSIGAAWRENQGGLDSC